MRRSYLKAVLVMLADDPGAAAEFACAFARGVAGGPRRLRNELHAWHRTVQCWQDPRTIAALTDPFDAAELVEVFPPA